MRYEIYKVQWDDGVKFHVIQLYPDVNDLDENYEFINCELMFDDHNIPKFMHINPDDYPMYTWEQYSKKMCEDYAY